ncbi:cyclic AMP-dependent transcription factor ATF-1 isoform X2 [Micropterus salmoides]|uniref:cyclic AMP-dependent transcription factor ATF-1 isoform X2 n=1 Tax=Micropterus salmoides TaxID=27706 RepID=UPI0018EB0A0A|nr:cyclic AMP-dependent transcription factor ATF-1 isoform X2 [Micropterus salmoides]XP_045932364.1 cyclic AMP-dependent transcription factor ATF-1 isoform X2 [Micropterus dolomieu]
MEEVQQGSNGTESQTTIIPTTITTSQFSQIAQQMSLGGSSVAVVQLPGGQFQVQGVIQSAQSSVIQSPQMQSSQGSDSEDSQDSSDSGVTAQKTREILARRPSYRKILNELSSEEMAHIEGKDNSPVSTGVTVPTTQIYQTSSGQYITIAANGTIQLATPGSEGIHGLQTVTMANSGGAQQGTTILQYAQTPDGQQILVPSNQVVVQGAGGEMQTYQIRTAPTSSSLSQTVVMTSPVGLSQGKTDDPTVKREIRLAKNREAARECRRKKKEYVKCLENRVAVLENQNKTLIEELKTLKDLYCVKTG